MVRINPFVLPLIVSRIAAPALALAQQTIEPARAQQLASQHACFGCHAIDRKLVGPAYRDVAARYAGHQGAFDQLVQHVENGSAGVWGSVPMPPNHIDHNEAQAIVQWILAGAKNR
jgi:cytochrome c